ncbi:hypothetical protein [Marinobacter alkaliphilus]|uniref:Uncharacterized protein n=1 Tax=Marinobacter alkaliphilus TaxID=254719 RepID=A0ABZ3EAB8_9GAMM
MTQIRGHSDRRSGEDESISWFGAFAGGGLAATMFTLFASFLWWAIATLTESTPSAYAPAIMFAVFIGCWIGLSIALWKTR